MTKHATTLPSNWAVQRGLPAVTLALFLLALWAAFILAPTERTLGDVQRIFYFHVASAWTAFLAFFLVFVGGVGYLRTRDLRWDILAGSSAEIGVVFTTLALITGSIWGKHAWGTWWEWEPRLTTTMLLWLIYISYLLLRSTLPDRNRRANFSAVFGIVGFVDVPIVFMSIRWWRSIHPTVVGREGMDMVASMWPAFFLALAAFTSFYVCLMVLRTSVERSRVDLERLRERDRFLVGGVERHG